MRTARKSAVEGRSVCLTVEQCKLFQGSAKAKDVLHGRIRRWGFDDGEPFQLRSFNYARKAYHAGKEMVVCVTSIPCPILQVMDKLSVK